MNTYGVAVADWSGHPVGTFQVSAPMRSGVASADGALVLSGRTVYAITGRVVGTVGTDSWEDGIRFSPDDRSVCDLTNPPGGGAHDLRLLRLGQLPHAVRSLPPGGWDLLGCGGAGGVAVIAREDAGAGLLRISEVLGVSMRDGTQVFSFSYPNRVVTSAVVSLDGTLMAEGGWPDGVHVRQLPGGRRLARFADARDLPWLFSGDDTRLVLHHDTGQVRVVAWRTGKVLDMRPNGAEVVPRPGLPDLLIVVPAYPSEGATLDPDRRPPLVRLFLLDARGSIRQTWP